MRPIKVTRNLQGTSITFLDTGDKFTNTTMPIQYWEDTEKDIVWLNAPVSLTKSEFYRMKDAGTLGVSFTNQSDDAHFNKLMSKVDGITVVHEVIDL